MVRQVILQYEAEVVQQWYRLLASSVFFRLPSSMIGSFAVATREFASEFQKGLDDVRACRADCIA